MSTSADTYDLVIVGSGPGGISTALHVHRLEPGLASRTLVLEKEHHPRHKLCGGGLTLLSQFYLARLGIHLQMNHVPVHHILIKFDRREINVRGENLIKIVRRDRYDAAMVGFARERGIEVREGVTVTGVQVEPDGVVLSTDHGPVRARAVVAADGAKSVVRRHIGLEERSRVCRAIEILTPEDPAARAEFSEHMAVFDFSDVPSGLQGYCWDFPSSVEGEPFMNRGVFDSRVWPKRPNADLKEIFSRYLAKQDIRLEDHRLMGNPSRWFDPEARFSVPRVLLVGDAAGIEPLGGDGISSSFGHGDAAASELVEAFRTGDFSFDGYRKRLLAHPVGKHMAGNLARARTIYGLRSRPALQAVFALMSARRLFRRPSRGLGL